MIPIWLAFLLSWVLWAIILAICSQFHLGISFDNDIALYVLCAPVVIPIFVIGIPIALFSKWFKNLKYYFEMKKYKKKK